MMPDPLIRWLDALNARHFAALNFQEVRRSVQALSALYVERRTRLGQGSAFDGAGKRASFATYFAPLHFLLVREIVRALGAASPAVSDILDLGCGTGIAGAAWALELEPHPRITGIDDFRVDMAPHGTLLILRNQDVPGVIGRVGTLLGDAGINIAGYHQSRVDAGGDALAVVNVDGRLDSAVLETLGRLPEIHYVRQVQLGRA